MCGTSTLVNETKDRSFNGFEEMLPVTDNSPALGEIMLTTDNSKVLG